MKEAAWHGQDSPFKGEGGKAVCLSVCLLSPLPSFLPFLSLLVVLFLFGGAVCFSEQCTHWVILDGKNLCSVEQGQPKFPGQGQGQETEKF